MVGAHVTCGMLYVSDCIQEFNRCLKKNMLKSAKYPDACYCYFFLIEKGSIMSPSLVISILYLTLHLESNSVVL